MATKDETKQALLDAIHTLATATKDPNQVSDTTVTSYADAAKNYAEAYAWLTSPAQSH